MTPPAWHACPAQQAIDHFASSAQGLSEAEAQQRLITFGRNFLSPVERRGPLQRFLMQFHNLLIYVLLASAIVTSLLAHWVDTAVIVGVVVINAIIGFLQEGKAEKAMDAIRCMLSPAATVVRDGKHRVVPAEHLVPGDIVLLQSGDKVPADLRLLSCKNLRIEEAVLTGESTPVEKSVTEVAMDAVLGDRFSMAYSGTLVVYGQGRGVVTATAKQTEIGRISTLLEEVSELSTPMLRKMAEFSRVLTIAILILAAVSFLIGWWVHHNPISEMFLAAVSVAVAAIPEGLPAIMTITLALGMQRMAKHQAIVRRLPAVEALGSVTVICTDKTGTLTRNEMMVTCVLTAQQDYEVSGEGYAPRGVFSMSGKTIDISQHLAAQEVFRIGLLCNDSTLRQHGSRWEIAGDPTEAALITLALKAGLDADVEHERLPRIDVIPFESEHRFMATLHHDHTGHAVVFVKGAPEEVLAMCAYQREQGEDRPLDLHLWHQKMATAGALGQRVLALAVKPVALTRRELSFDDVVSGFTLLGMVGITDPPREEAIIAVRECLSAGIRVKMITGDHAETARAIAAQLGVGAAGVLTGAQIDTMDEAALRQAVLQVDVFARASPQHKLRLVLALQAAGEIVAMTGDGVNDAPALKRADIGVAMGMKGTEVAKEAAQMVLTDDNFATIAHAVQEGRTVYDNIKKAIVFVVPTNGGEAGMVLIAILFGLTLPITPVQILWVNMVTAVTLALALSFEKSEAGVMQRPPRVASAPMMSGFMLWRIAFVSALLTLGPYLLFLWEVSQGASIALSRTVAVNALVMGEVVYLFNCRYLLAPVMSKEGLFGNSMVLVSVVILLLLQLLFTYLPAMQQLFGTVPVDTSAWLHILGFGVVLFLVVEGEKAWFRRRGKQY